MNIIRYWPKWMEEYEEDSAWPITQQNGLNIHETDKEIIVKAIVAGIPTDQVEAKIENGILTIKAESKKEDKSDNGYKSSSYQYYYTTALSGGAWDKTEAEVKHGILTVTIPKAEAAKPKKITIKTK